MIRYIRDELHYTEVVERIRQVERYLWIGTADNLSAVDVLLRPDN